MKKLFVYTFILILMFLVSCTSDALFNTTPPRVIIPESIEISTPFTEAVTYFAVHNNQLYAGTKNTTSGAEVYIYDGSNMVLVYASADPDYLYVDSMYSFNGRLYIGLKTNNGARVLRTVDDTVYPHTWQTVHTEVPDYLSVGAITEYAGQIYIAVSSFDNGGGEKVKVYRSPTGDSFVDNVTGGWLGHNNEAANFITYNGNLYIATIKDYNHFGDGGELFFYNGTVWDARVDDNAPGVMPGGFGDPENMGIPSFADFNGYFYMGVRNQQQGLVTPPVASTGCKIWRSSDMASAPAYEQIIAGGFGDINNISVDSMIVYGGYIYAFTRNYNVGTQMWRSSNGNPGTWTKRNQNGFGDATNVSGRAVIIHDGILYIGLESATAGATIIQYGAAP